MMKKHDYIERCPKCGKYMTWKQIQSHECTTTAIPCFSVKEIPVLYCYETEDENGKVFIAHGLDGTLYRLVKKSLSDDSYHDPSNRRRVNRTKKRILFSTKPSSS
jgi:hypothetical protein